VAEYRSIDGFPGYRVGDDGSVWSCWAYNGHQPRRLGETWKRLVARASHDGYLSVGLYRSGRAHRRKVHLLVLEAFIGPRPPGLEGCHNDGHPANCALGNLRWDTHRENQTDRVRHGTVPRGSRSGVAKLNEAAVADIRKRLAAGATRRELAMAFGVSPSTISAIRSGQNWGWLRREAACG
jgi:hypothetical protein